MFKFISEKKKKSSAVVEFLFRSVLKCSFQHFKMFWLSVRMLTPVFQSRSVLFHTAL